MQEAEKNRENGQNVRKTIKKEILLANIDTRNRTEMEEKRRPKNYDKNRYRSIKNQRSKRVRTQRQI